MVRDSGLSFEVHALKATNISIEEFESGAFSLCIDGHAGARVSALNGKLTLTVPAGEHKVELKR
jgi:hypothetical protein